jgi:hypothetical protein
VPEQSAWAMMLIGLAGLGYWASVSADEWLSADSQ